MADIHVDEIGPVDYLVGGFPADRANFSGAVASELKTLIDSNTVRVPDLVRRTKAHDGSVEASELRDADASEIGDLPGRSSVTSRSCWPSRTSRRSARRSSPGARPPVLVWENTWAAPFGSAVSTSGGELLGNGRIPTQALGVAVEADRQAVINGA